MVTLDAISMLCYNKPMFHRSMIKLAICASIAVSALPLNTLKADSSSKFFVERMTALQVLCRTPVPENRWPSSCGRARVLGSGYDPQTRCQIVSNRFNQLYTQGLLTHLTTGRKNGSNIICGAASKGSGCAPDGMLYTLKPGQDPTQTLKNLLAVRTKATSALTESASRLYISIEEIEEAQDPSSTYTITKPAKTTSSSYTSTQSISRPAVAPVRTSSPSTNETLW